MAPNQVEIDEHWSILRSNLHDPNSWSDGNDISLTYVPTLAGFTGMAQRDHFCSIYGPSSRHPFHPATSSRFDNRLQRLSIVVDRERCMIVEELAASLLHHETIGWLLPNQPETRRVLNIQFVMVGELDRDQPHLLKSVRVYWDQGALLKEAGLLARSLVGAARAGIKNFDETAAVDQMFIADGSKAKARLFGPTPCNCNHLAPLDAARAEPDVAVHSCASPVFGLSNMSAILKNLPDTHQLPIPRRDHPALTGHNAIVGEEVLLKTTECGLQEDVPRRCNPVFKTTMEFKDHFEPASVDPNIKTYRPKNIFTGPVESVLPTLSLDPKRNQSSIFSDRGGDGGTVLPPRPIDMNRFTSTVFNRVGGGGGDDDRDEQQLKSFPSNKARFESQIFDDSASGEPHVQTAVPKQLVCHIAGGEATTISTSPRYAAMSDIDPNRFTSHINFTEINTSEGETNGGKLAHNRSVSSNSILLGGGDDASAPEPRRAHKANVSSITFDFDNPVPVSQQPSTRHTTTLY